MQALAQTQNDAAFISISQLLKATPAVEGGQRCIYIEASNEAIDQQGEIVLAKALAESAEFYLRYGNLDIDHVTQIGAQVGIPNYELYEIGRPLDVRVDGPRTFVKGEIFTGAGPAAEKANNFWQSLTEIDPPQRWYPSVGGKVLDSYTDLDPKTQQKRRFVTKVRWTNIGFSKTPVNTTVPTVSTIPFGVLAKCWGVGGLDMSKALDAGYGTDAAALSGGAALRQQSLAGAPINYFDFRDAVSGHLSSGDIQQPTSQRICDFAVDTWGVDHDTASKWVERFMRDLNSGLKDRRKQ
ncbi:MAG TPA: hypothetical protein VFL54_01630 [Gammaproteobacteria bacterium]|nr:hypothetical protein [Gammaproteobacteria bacterium]